MSYREIDHEHSTPQIGDVTASALLTVLNGARTEFAFPCKYLLPPLVEGGENVLEPIHLTAEGYTNPVVAFAGAPAGLTGEAWIDEVDDSIVRVLISAQCLDAVERDVECDISVLITRPTDLHGDRTDIVVRGPLTIESAPFLAAQIISTPAAADTATLYSAMLGYGVMQELMGDVTGDVLTLTAGSAIIRGHFWEVGDEPMTLTLPVGVWGGKVRVVLRYTAATEAITLRTIPYSQTVEKSSTMFEVPLAVLEYETAWGQPEFAYEMAGTPADPVGSYRGFAHEAIPMSHHIADGRLLEKAVFPRLWARFGTTYGGSGNFFALPDRCGKVGVGLQAGDPDFGSLDQSTWAGDKEHVLAATEIPAHTHTTTLTKTENGAYGTGYVNFWTSDNAGVAYSRVSSSIGGGLAHNNLQPYATEVVCIRA